MTQYATDFSRTRIRRSARALARTKSSTNVSAVTMTRLAMTAILQFWLGSLDGDYWTTSAVVALAIAATATVILALERLLGMAGLAIGAALMMLLGNPLSGVATAPQMLPSGWGTLGQLLPPGAAATALRSVAFFDGAGATGALVVLGCWLLAGLVLFALPTRSRQPAVEAKEPVPV